MFVCKLHSDPIYSVAFSPDGAFLVTSSLDETVRITNLKTSEEVMSLPGSKFWCPIALTRDGKLLARGGYGVAAWRWSELGSAPFIKDARTDASAIAFSMDGKVLAAMGERRPLRRWSAPSGQKLEGGWGGVESDKQFPAGSLAYSPDGRLLGVSFAVFAGNRYDSVIRLCDADSGSLQGELQTTLFKMDHPTAVAFSPDGGFLAGVFGPALLLFDVASRKLLATARPGAKHFKGLAFTPDGRKLATVSNDRTARVWDVPSLSELEGFERQIDRNRDCRGRSENGGGQRLG